MVCTRPHPSVPLFFWGDESGEKFHNAYFDHFPGGFIFIPLLNFLTLGTGVWRQGDLMVVNPKTKGIMVLGRRYGTLLFRCTNSCGF